MPLALAPSIAEDLLVPEDYGLLAWNWQPVFALTTTTQPLLTAGRLNCWTVPIRYPLTVTNINLYLMAAGSGLTSGSCGVALYSSTGALIGSNVTAGLATAWASTGYKTHALTGGPFTVNAAGTVTAVAWYNGTTPPNLLRGVGVTDINLALTGTNNILVRVGLADTTITTTPPSTLGSKTATGNSPFWVGLS